MRAHVLRIVPIVLAALLGGLVVATAATAADSKERIGDRVNLLAGRYQTFPAGTPFHVAHGWGLVPDGTDADALGKSGFSLALDGSQRRADFVDKYHETSPALGCVGLPVARTARRARFCRPGLSRRAPGMIPR